MAPPPALPFSFTIAPSVTAFAVPLGTYVAAHPELNAVATGAFVFDSQGRLLLVQRAAHDSYPGRWETPGGACDPEDDTILHGVARELWEEAGLIARRVLARTGAEKPQIFITRRGRLACRLCFEIDVDRGDTPPAVILDPNEHQAYVWASEQECRTGRTTDGDIELKFTTPHHAAEILDGFRAHEERIKAEAA